MNISTLDWLLLVVLGAIWGGSYFLVEIALVGLPVMPLVAARIVLAAAALWIFVLATRQRVPTDARTWFAFLVMGIMNNIIPFTLIVWGQVEITSSLAAILTATTPIFAVIVAALWLQDEPVTPAKISAIVIGFLGVVVMIGPDALREVGAAVLAQLAVLGAALSYSLASAFGKRFSAWGIKPVVSATGQVTMSSLVFGAIVLATHGTGPFLDADARSWLAVVTLAVLCTSIAYILYFRILSTAGATNLMLVTFLIPVSAIGLGVFVLDETLRPQEIAGMLMIGLALLAIDGRAYRAAVRRIRAW